MKQSTHLVHEDGQSIFIYFLLLNLCVKSMTSDEDSSVTPVTSMKPCSRRTCLVGKGSKV